MSSVPGYLANCFNAVVYIIDTIDLDRENTREIRKLGKEMERVMQWLYELQKSRARLQASDAIVHLGETLLCPSLELLLRFAPSGAGPEAPCMPGVF